MTRANSVLTAAKLRKVLKYDMETGIFSWDINAARNARAGSTAGCHLTSGYIQITVNGSKYRAHILAFLYVTGKWPKDEIDHIDRNPKNNRWENLREATRSENAANSIMKSNNTSGFKGVSWSKSDKKWVGAIRVRGKHFYLGSFDTPEEAHEAYKMAAKEGFGDFARW